MFSEEKVIERIIDILKDIKDEMKQVEADMDKEIAVTYEYTKLQQELVELKSKKELLRDIVKSVGFSNESYSKFMEVF